MVGPSPALGGLQIPAGLVVGLAPATLEFWVRFPNDMPGYQHVVGPITSEITLALASLIQVLRKLTTGQSINSRPSSALQAIPSNASIR